MASSPVFDSQISLRIPRPSRQRAQVFGYILHMDWIIDFGHKHNVDPQGTKNHFGLVVDSVELIHDELKKEGGFATVRYPSFAKTPTEVAQIYVARNFSLPMKGSTTPALIRTRLEKLKRFLGTTDEPQWLDF